VKNEDRGMKNIFEQLFVTEDDNEPPSKMCHSEKNRDTPRLSCLFSGHNWSILYRQRKLDEHFLVVPAVRRLFLG